MDIEDKIHERKNLKVIENEISNYLKNSSHRFSDLFDSFVSRYDSLFDEEIANG